MSKACLLVICLLVTPFTGCIIENDSSTYEIFDVIHVGGQFAPDSDQDQETVNEFIENLTENGWFENRQNITWEKYEHNFVIESNWKVKYVTLLLNVDYEFGGAENPGEGPAGTLDISIKDPNGGEHADGFEIVTWNNQINERLYALPNIDGDWTIVISGSGLEGVGGLVYSGTYDIRVKTEGLI